MSTKEVQLPWSTPPFDPRFPNQNQTKACWVNYCDFYRCQKLFPGDEKCDYFKKTFTSLCPSDWVMKWDEQRENGVFSGEHLINRPLRNPSN